MWTSVLPAAYGMLGLGAVMAALWLVQRRTGNAGIVDAGWTFGVGALSLVAAATGDGWTGRRVAIGVAVAVWSALSVTSNTTDPGTV